MFVSVGRRERVRVDAFGGIVERWEDVRAADLRAGDLTPRGRVKRSQVVGAEVLVTLEDGRTRRCWHTDLVSRRADISPNGPALPAASGVTGPAATG